MAAPDVALLLRDIEGMRGSFNSSEIDQSIEWIRQMDGTTWTPVPLHWGEAGRLRGARCAAPLVAAAVAGAAAAVHRPRGGERKVEVRADDNDDDAPAVPGVPAPGVAPRSEVSAGGRVISLHRCPSGVCGW